MFIVLEVYDPIVPTDLVSAYPALFCLCQVKSSNAHKAQIKPKPPKRRRMKYKKRIENEENGEQKDKENKERYLNISPAETNKRTFGAGDGVTSYRRGFHMNFAHQPVH